MEEETNIEQEAVNSEQQTKEKCEEYLAGWKRAQADYANLKRETDNQKIEYVKFANARMLEELLPVIEHFNAAVASVPTSTDENWLKGIRAVQSAMESALRGLGVEQVIAVGQFDPSEHEAVGEEAQEGTASGSIIRIAQVGWKLNGKLLRPAKVIVAK